MDQVMHNWSVVCDWWLGLGGEVHLWAWYASGLALFVFAVWCAWRAYLKASGARRFRGTWYSAEQYEVLMWQIDQDNRNGQRVMKRDEMEHLRRWKFGGSGKGLFKFRKGSYF